MKDVNKRKKIGSTILYWVILNAGTLMLAAGVYFFKAPNNFATGGVSGISIILSRFITPINDFTNQYLRQTEIMWIINFILLIIGFIFLGKSCTLKTAYCSIVYTCEMELMRFIFPLDHSLTDQIFLEFVLAMLMTSIGSAIIFNCKASSGGTDIAALIIKKYTKIDTGKALLLTDFLIAGSTFFVFQDITTGLFSLLGLFTKAFLVDGVIENIGKSKYVTVITATPAPIQEYILQKMNRGFTSFKAQGGYTGEEKTVILVVCKRGEALKLKTKITAADPASFVIITDANEILGKGFRDTI